MTHEEAIKKLFKVTYAKASMLKLASWYSRNVCKFEQWQKNDEIPEIHIGNVAKLIGVDAGDLSEFWKGKDIEVQFFM